MLIAPASYAYSEFHFSLCYSCQLNIPTIYIWYLGKVTSLQMISLKSCK
uniref:Uncharacterized protein n=1 Tax=Rhizophora mucronata TaxID=61149 RepID=A0A2P2PZI4_RHIMU